MQVMQPHINLETPGQSLPAAKGAAKALNLAAQTDKTADTAANAVPEGFDNALAALLTTLNSDSGRQKTVEKISEAVEKHQAETPEGQESDDAMAILESLLAASQHPVTSVPLKGNSEGGEQKVDAVMLQSRGASAGNSPAASQPQLQAQQLQAQQPHGAENAEQKEAPAAGVKLVATQPMAATTQEIAMLNASQMTPVNPESTAAASGQEISTQAAGATDNNARFTLPEVKLSGESSRWSDQLNTALGERLQVQVKDKIQHATIRLDPPNMGKIDISMQIDNGRMQLHINASHGDVYRAIQQVSHELRQSLVEQNFVQVNVQVSSQHPGQQQENRQQAFADLNDAVMKNADMAEDDNFSSHQDDESVLLTV